MTFRNLLVVVIMGIVCTVVLACEATRQPDAKAPPDTVTTPKKKVAAPVTIPAPPAIRIWSRNAKMKSISPDSPEKPVVIFSPNQEGAFGNELIVPKACKDLMVRCKLEKVGKKSPAICVAVSDKQEKKASAKSFAFAFKSGSTEIVLLFRQGVLVRIDLLNPKPRTLFFGGSARAKSAGFFMLKREKRSSKLNAARSRDKCPWVGAIAPTQ